jgi:hypothetical protein
MADRPSVGVGYGVQLGVHAAFRASNEPPETPFCPQARSRAVRFEIGRVDHHDAPFGVATRQAHHHPEEDARLAPPLPAIVERLVRTESRRRDAPAKPVPIDEDDPAQDAAIIYPGPAVALREIGFQPSHLLVRQPKQVTYDPDSSGA